MRIGQGIDVHRFSDDPARPLMLGLVHVSEGPGLIGHSDADAATHALCDAILGALGRGDLGRQFPDSDPAFHNIASRQLLMECLDFAARDGFRVVSADVTIVAEQPRLALYMPAMAQSLSEVIGTHVSVKATTTEGLGFVGRGEGIAALCVVLMEEA